MFLIDFCDYASPWRRLCPEVVSTVVSSGASSASSLLNCCFQRKLIFVAVCTTRGAIWTGFTCSLTADLENINAVTDAGTLHQPEKSILPNGIRPSTPTCNSGRRKGRQQLTECCFEIRFVNHNRGVQGKCPRQATQFSGYCLETHLQVFVKTRDEMTVSINLNAFCKPYFHILSRKKTP